MFEQAIQPQIGRDQASLPLTMRLEPPPTRWGEIERQSSSMRPLSTSWPLNVGPPSASTTSAPRSPSAASHPQRSGVPCRCDATRLVPRGRACDPPRVRPRDHERPGLTVALVGEEREFGVEIDRSAHHRKSRCFAPAGGDAHGCGFLRGSGNPIALGPNGARRRHDPIAARSIARKAIESPSPPSPPLTPSIAIAHRHSPPCSP